jgi:hypothetical protein
MKTIIPDKHVHWSQEQMEEGLSKWQYVEKQEINQNLGQNQIKEHELEIEHVPTRTKLGDEKLGFAHTFPTQ